MNHLLLLDALRRIHCDSGAYDPVAGRGACGERVSMPAPDGTTVLVPRSMVADADYRHDMPSLDWKRLRCRHDFEFWCATCVTIKDKRRGYNVPFILNTPQRQLAAVLEADRVAGRPIRIIMLKARQWGGSTLVQIYMAWIQICHRRNWHSLICAHVKDIAATIRGMYTKVIDNYPESLWEWDNKPAFRPFERSVNTRFIEGPECRVTVASAENYEAVRGADYAMAHLSEAAFWPSTPGKSPESLIRAVGGAIALEPYTIVVIESTANGVGNYFHTEWLRSCAALSDKKAVFVPWYEIDFYRQEPPAPEEFLASLTPYEKGLWTMGLTLDRIYWYRSKRREYISAADMHAEYPTTDTEAFTSTGAGVFPAGQVERLAADCTPGVQGDLAADASRFVPASTGRTSLWEAPRPGRQYIVAVDVGGRSDKSDWSVIAVLSIARRPEVVAQWRGHVDHDLLAVEAERMARFYNNALLVLESNTFETAVYGGDAADSNLFVLSRLAERYSNLYTRRAFDKLTGTETERIGFHTNRATKAMMIAGLIEAVRDEMYIEHSRDACNELTTYRALPNGSYAATDGCHDDILMTRAMALLVIKTEHLADADTDADIEQQSW